MFTSKPRKLRTVLNTNSIVFRLENVRSKVDRLIDARRGVPRTIIPHRSWLTWFQPITLQDGILSAQSNLSGSVNNLYLPKAETKTLEPCPNIPFDQPSSR